MIIIYVLFNLVWEHMLLQLCTAGPLLLPPIQGKGPAVQTAAEKPEKRNLTHMFSRYVLQINKISTFAVTLVKCRVLLKVRKLSSINTCDFFLFTAKMHDTFKIGGPTEFIIFTLTFRESTTLMKCI